MVRAACPRLEHVTVASSGLNPQRLLGHIEAMLTSVQATNNQLHMFEVQISLDGIEDMHDQVRGIRGFWGKVQQSLAGLAELRHPLPGTARQAQQRRDAREY